MKFQEIYTNNIIEENIVFFNQGLNINDCKDIIPYFI